MQGRGDVADFFMRPPNLKASNFAALLFTGHIFTELKDLNLLKKYVKNQETRGILKIGFALQGTMIGTPSESKSCFLLKLLQSNLLGIFL